MTKVKDSFKFILLLLIISFFLYYYVSGNCLGIPLFLINFFDSILSFIKMTIFLLFQSKIGLIFVAIISIFYFTYDYFREKQDEGKSSDKPDKKVTFFIVNFLLIFNPIPSSKTSIKIYNKYFPEPVFKSITNNFAASFYENRSTLLFALYIAIIIRSLLLQPFYIPSSSMEPNLLVGDRIFVSKYSYGYSKHSFPFSPPIFKGRILSSEPERGDVVVFKTPADNRTDYIKRLIGLPGDTIKFIDSNLHINNSEVLKSRISKKDVIYCGANKIDVFTFEEILPNQKKHKTVYIKSFPFQNSDSFKVPKDHYFFLGDNRDCSKDSRYLSSVGYVHKDNLVGKAQFIFFSSDTINRPIFNFWKCVDKPSLRYERLFKKIN